MKKTIHKDYAGFSGFVSDLHDGLFENSGIILRYERNCVKVFPVEDQKIVVKKFKRPNVFNRVVYTLLRGSKAERAYRNALRLLELGVGTPRPIGFVDVGKNGLLADCYLATEYTDYRPVADIISESEHGGDALFNSFVAFTVGLHEKGVRHDDYNMSNVLYKRRVDGEFEFALIDVNRMKFGKLNKNACMHNVKRVCASPEFTFKFIKKYSELRNWNIYRHVAWLSIIRLAFERRGERKTTIKQWMKRLSHA